MNDIEALQLVGFMIVAMIIPFIPFHREITQNILPKIPFLNTVFVRALRFFQPLFMYFHNLKRYLQQGYRTAVLAFLNIIVILSKIPALVQRLAAGPGTGAEKKPPAGSPPSKSWTALLSPVYPLNRFRQLGGREPARLQPGPERRPLNPVPAVPRLTASPSPPADAEHADPVPVEQGDFMV